jgi:hypothetical protein
MPKLWSKLTGRHYIPAANTDIRLTFYRVSGWVGKEKETWTSLTPAEIYDLMPHKEPPGVYNSTDILNVVRAAEAELRQRNGQAQ